MSKRKDRSPRLFSETADVMALLEKEANQTVVAIFVPSHNRHSKPLGGSAMGEWTEAAMKLVADLYGGGTAFESLSGIYKTTDGKYLLDKPRVVESLAKFEDIEDPEKLNRLVGFAKRMGKTLDQETVMIALGNVGYYIEDYTGVV